MKVYAARMGNKWFDGSDFCETQENAKIYGKCRSLKTRITSSNPNRSTDGFDTALLASGGEIVEFDLVPNPEGSIPIVAENVRILEETRYIPAGSYIYDAIIQKTGKKK